MAKVATITQLSPTMKEGLLVEWLKKEGDPVKPGDVIASIETDKAVMDLEAYDSGILLRQLAAKGSKLPVGAAIGIIGNKDENIDALVKDAASAAQPSAPAGSTTPANAQAAPAVAAAAATEVPHAGASERIKASPLARKVAAQRGVDLGSLKGTGPGGRIVMRDVDQRGTIAPPVTQGANRAPLVIHAAHGQRAPDTRVALSPMRQTIATRLSWAKQNIPHFYLSRTINTTRLQKLRGETNTGLAALRAKESEENAHLPAKVSLNDFIIAAAAQSLVRHPEMLRQYSAGEGEDSLLQLGNVDVGFAVSLEDGLITPVIRNAEQYTLFQLAIAAQELAARARARKLLPEEYTGGGFTISNLGMMGVTSFQAIINAPEGAILAVGATERRAFEDDAGKIQFGDFLSLNLACDHRVIDGATGAQFLDTLARFLENPGLIR